MLQAAETLCHKATNKFLYPAPPEPGSSQAADVTFPANSIAPWKNTRTPSQGQDPIRAATATADTVPNERRILKTKVNCDEPVSEPGFPCFPQYPCRESRQHRYSKMQWQLTHSVSGLKPVQSMPVPKQGTDDQAALRTSYTKSIWNRFWLIHCNLLTSMSSLGLWQLARLLGKQQFPHRFRQASASIIASFTSRKTEKALCDVLR